jgi:hypothetical protein
LPLGHLWKQKQLKRAERDKKVSQAVATQHFLVSNINAGDTFEISHSMRIAIQKIYHDKTMIRPYPTSPSSSGPITLSKSSFIWIKLSVLVGV